MAEVLNIKRPHEMIGPRDELGESWALQDGKLFNWSESNCRFERAWWLDTDIRETPIILALRRERPDPRAAL